MDSLEVSFLKESTSGKNMLTYVDLFKGAVEHHPLLLGFIQE